MLRAQVMDPQDQTSSAHPERRSHHLPSIHLLRRSPSPLLRSTHPTYGQFAAYEQSSTPFPHANLDEPIPHKQEPERTPRPPNAWILFRSHMTRGRTDLEGRPQSEISAIVSRAWRDASPDVRLPFEELAETKRAEHRIRYPNYRFNPIKKSVKLGHIATHRNRTPYLEGPKRDLDVFEKAYHRADRDVCDREAQSEQERQALRDEIRLVKPPSLKVAEVRLYLQCEVLGGCSSSPTTN